MGWFKDALFGPPVSKPHQPDEGALPSHSPTVRPKPKLFVTLSPGQDHFAGLCSDTRLEGLRMNVSMLSPQQVADDLQKVPAGCPLYFDVKGRQLRVEEVRPNSHYCDIVLNHPIDVNMAEDIIVLFKAGNDAGQLGELLEGGRRLVFSKGNPQYRVKPGESIHIRHPSLKVDLSGGLFSATELEKIRIVREAGITRWFLSYVESQDDVDQFRALVGPEAEVLLKIESPRGLEFVRKDFKKDDKTRLVAACGDLYVEVAQPHHILNAMKDIIAADPQAIAGSRMLLSVVHEPLPSFADLAQLAWIRDLGYNTFMLCDELCLIDSCLRTAINVFDAFRADYC